jgi:hypothetical protein
LDIISFSSFLLWASPSAFSAAASFLQGGVSLELEGWRRTSTILPDYGACGIRTARIEVWAAQQRRPTVIW